MTTWTVPAAEAELPIITAANTSATTQATPLAWSKAVQKGQVEPQYINAQISNAFWGEVGGCLGETSALALLIGGAYLMFRRTITWHIPAAVLLSSGGIALATWLMNPQAMSTAAASVRGGLLICALLSPLIRFTPLTAGCGFSGWESGR